MRYQIIRNVLFSVATGALFSFAMMPAHGLGFDDPKPSQSPAPASPDLDAAKSQAHQMGDEIIVITKKIPKEEKPAPGPPSKEKLLMDEARERLELLKTMQSQTMQAIKQAEEAKNPAEAQVLARDAKQKAEFAEHFKQTITGPPPGAASPSSGPSTNPGMASKVNFNSGAFEQLKESAKISQSAASDHDPGAAKQRSNEAFGAGRAGAGGVTLYKAATVVTVLDKSKISNAAVENSRLVLVYDQKKILFPKFDPEFLAIAIRSVYGGEGLVKGTLLANEDNAVVLRTGKEQYGDVAWKKEFLPQLPKELTLGQDLALDLGPGVGALDLPEPSFERITYYGPLKGNSLGQVVQESDMVYSMFWNGTDWKTGLPLDLSKIPGYKSAIELDLENPAPPSARPEQPAKNWWEETVWFVWAPNEMLLEMTPDGSEFRFKKATMQVVVWSVRPENVSDRTKAQGEFLTQHFDDFGRAFPVLERLREAAKTLAVVRWLKLNNVPLDQTWAKTYTLAKVTTPDKVRRYSVYISRDKSGKPTVESPATGGTR